MEVCVDSVSSAINAESGGACRVELCANLMEGGTTPSTGTLRVMKQFISIPVFAMIRPRGGDFCYNDKELLVMKQDIKDLKQAGADGFVFGVLTKDGEVDREICNELLAIDMSYDIMQSMDVIMSLGFDRILTSGGSSSAADGVKLLKQMIQMSDGKIKIVPGGGITVHNLESVLQSGADEFHGTARMKVDSCMTFQKYSIGMGSQPNAEYFTMVTCRDIVHKMLSIAHSFWKEKKEVL